MITLKLPYEEVGLMEVRDHIAKGTPDNLSLPRQTRCPMTGGVPVVAAEVAARPDYGPLVALFEECTIAVPSNRPSAEQVLLSLLKF